MKCSAQHLFTPIYLKLREDMPWPTGEPVFYLLTRDDLFLCRNTPFFRSCVPVREFPSELGRQQPFLKLSYPRIPRPLLEQVIGFFDLIGERFSSEAAVLIVWNRNTNSIEIVVPEQVGICGTSWSGKPYPLELEYQVPPLPPHLMLIGDIHSHVDGPAYASSMDKLDEAYRPGLHLVVGRILDEPPQFHCEATADGFRFRVRDLSMVLEGYHRRRTEEVPAEWISKVTTKPWSTKPAGNWSQKNAADPRGTGYGSSAESQWQDLEARALGSDGTPGPGASNPPAESASQGKTPPHTSTQGPAS